MIQLPKDPEEEWVEQNPTIPQILERLAVVAEDMVVVHTNKYGTLYELPYSDERFSDRDFKKNEVQWQLFGAACEKIESLDWAYSFEINSAGDYVFYVHDYSIMQAITTIISTGKSPNDLCQAALQALLAALEGREEKCEHCINGVQSDPIKGTDLAVNTHCPACKGSGEKQEVKV